MATKNLSILHINGVDYHLKDADLRAAVQTAGKGGLTDSDVNLATSKAIKDYVDAQVGAVHAFNYEVVDVLPAASEKTMFIIYLVPSKRVGEQNIYTEYLTIRSGKEGEYKYAFESIGTTEVDLSDYVTDVKYETETRTLKMVDAAGTHDLHTFGTLAEKNSATGTVAGQDIENIKAKGTSAGTIEVALTQSPVEAKVVAAAYTPEGTVTGTVTPTGTVSMTENNDTLTGVQVKGTISSVNQMSASVDGETLTFAVEAVTPTFTGSKYDLGFAGDSNDIAAAFEGTKKENAIVSTVTYNQAGVDTSKTKFNPAALELAVDTIKVAEKSVTVE